MIVAYIAAPVVAAKSIRFIVGGKQQNRSTASANIKMRCCRHSSTSSSGESEKFKIVAEGGQQEEVQQWCSARSSTKRVYAAT
jgi:hypothetical protein